MNVSRMARSVGENGLGDFGIRCCGFWDEEVVGPDEEKYLIGFNFGH